MDGGLGYSDSSDPDDGSESGLDDSSFSTDESSLMDPTSRSFTDYVDGKNMPSLAYLVENARHHPTGPTRFAAVTPGTIIPDEHRYTTRHAVEAVANFVGPQQDKYLMVFGFRVRRSPSLNVRIHAWATSRDDRAGTRTAIELYTQWDPKEEYHGVAMEYTEFMRIFAANGHKYEWVWNYPVDDITVVDRIPKRGRRDDDDDDHYGPPAAASTPKRAASAE